MVGYTAKIIIGIVLFSLFSCSASYYLKRAQAKGAIIDPIEIKTTDTIYKPIYDTANGSLISFDTIYRDNIKIIYKTKYVPLTRQQRLLYKDSLKFIRKMAKIETRQLKDSIKATIKLSKIDSKQQTKVYKYKTKAGRNNWWKWLLTGFAFGIIISIIWKFKKLLI